MTSSSLHSIIFKKDGTVFQPRVVASGDTIELEKHKSTPSWQYPDRKKSGNMQGGSQTHDLLRTWADAFNRSATSSHGCTSV